MPINMEAGSMYQSTKMEQFINVKNEELQSSETWQ